MTVDRQPQGLPQVTICINTRNRPEGLARLLNSLAPQTLQDPTCQIVVVNDGSHNTHYAMVVGRFGAAVEYYPLDRAVGIPAARNMAVSRALGQFLVFVDDDCVVPPFWLAWLRARLASQPELDVVAGVTRPLLPEPPNFMAKVQAAFGLYPNPEKRLGGLRFVTANLAIRRSLFDQVGGFRAFEAGPASGSDTDLSNRVCGVASTRRLDLDWFVFHDVGEPVLACMKRYWRYGYADTWLARFAPAVDGDLQTAPGPLLPFLKITLRANMRRACAHFPGKVQQIRAAALASLIQFGYFRGRHAALRASPPTSALHKAL